MAMFVLPGFPRLGDAIANDHNFAPSTVGDHFELAHFVVQFVLDTGSFLEDYRYSHYAGHHGHDAQADGR